MKKFFLMAATAATTLFAACSTNDEGVVKPEAGMANVTINISGVQAAQTRALDALGETGKLTLSNGYILVINGADQVSYKEMLSITPLTAGATAVTQTLAQKVPTDSRIYILGNIPSDINVDTMFTLASIEDAVSAIANNTSYTGAVLANSTGAVAPLSDIDTTAGTAKCVIHLSPLFSRMELVKVVGGEHITGFTVAGVYVDDYFASFNMMGGAEGTQWSQGTSKDFTQATTDKMSTVGTWAATKVGTEWISAPASGQIWANHMAASGLPRFIIHLKNITYLAERPGDPGNYDVPATVAGDRYLTVTGYDEALTNFVRGKIYRVGSTAGIKFELKDLGQTPNPTDVNVTATVDVIDWMIETLTPEL